MAGDHFSAPVVGIVVVQFTVNPPSRTFVTRRSRVRTPVTRVAVGLAVDVAVDVREAVRVASGVDVLVAVRVDDGVRDGPGVTVASITMIVPAMPAEADDPYAYVPATEKSSE